MAPALAAGQLHCVETGASDPLSVLLLMEIVGDPSRCRAINVVNGAGGEIGNIWLLPKRIAKVAFTGSTEVGQQIMQYATQNIIPRRFRARGKSPNISLWTGWKKRMPSSIKPEGFALFAFNQWRSLYLPAARWCRSPSMSALWSAPSAASNLSAAVTRSITLRRWGQVSHGQLGTILNYIDIGKKEAQIS